MTEVQAIQQDVAHVARQLLETGHMKDGLFVIGCSTSEVAGERIGTSGSEAIAEVLFDEWQEFSRQSGAQLAFQCCEHLNRSLVVEREVQKAYGLTEVTAIPVAKAGGSMASYAYKHMKDPVLVETVQAQGGVDIGDTLIGMHLKRVAVPLRIEQKSIGQAHVTVARTRPPLIGGARAVYEC
ncbi:TIGR01440 family protein [Halobacillus sp. Marseille-Q1614]|uniref:TIGR01440 family protein n=1 Tax=Halobacillus sp. Marseille-Q1614 TaxID=2709134 RepID=UPI00157152C8|nr:TIGR01440 family protein [Halobacillus sp. Marseille-Q1614]